MEMHTVGRISRHIAKPKTPKTTPTPAPADNAPKKEDTAAPPAESPSEISISTSDVVCSHGKLDPEKAGDMKVIRAVSMPFIPSVKLSPLSFQSAHARIAEEDGCVLAPKLTPADVCPSCVERMFNGAFVAPAMPEHRNIERIARSQAIPD